jgi:hypothetical protein
MDDITRRRLDILLLGAIVVACWAAIIAVAILIVSLTARPAHADQLVCCGPSGQLWPCAAGDAQCRGPLGLSCTGTGVSIVPASACAAATPTPTPTATPTATPAVTPTPTPSGPVELGFDPLQVYPSFAGPDGARVIQVAGSQLWPGPGGKAWTLASNVEPDNPVTPGTATWVGWGAINKINISTPLGLGGEWHAAISTNTIDAPCPLTCEGWLWGTVQDSTLDDPGAPEYDVDSDITMYLQADWVPTGGGKARLVAQLAFDLADGSGWAELDLNLGMASWPYFTTGKPGYVWVAQPDLYRAGDGLRYYVVMDGPALGFEDAAPWGAMRFWRIPVSALVRKARADNPTAFPVSDDARVSAFGLAWEQYGEERQDIHLQGIHLWAHGPQAMPTPPAKAATVEMQARAAGVPAHLPVPGLALLHRVQSGGQR